MISVFQVRLHIHKTTSSFVFVAMLASNLQLFYVTVLDGSIREFLVQSVVFEKSPAIDTSVRCVHHRIVSLVNRKASRIRSKMELTGTITIF
mmetsp:Transcript_4051/g.8291  ORF Transcript_4051/g.8291 Transcript_4051/m.8291 type:complete len:92 (-) Transcript_4051:194-469(-)